MPDAILSDNGAQFACFRQGITQFERYLMDNEIRPHEALGHKPSASVYQPSTRALFEPLPYDYPVGAKLYKVNNWGYLRFGPFCVYLSETMADTYLEIRTSDADTFQVCYRNFQIAEIDASTGVRLNRNIKKL